VSREAKIAIPPALRWILLLVFCCSVSNAADVYLKHRRKAFRAAAPAGDLTYTNDIVLWLKADSLSLSDGDPVSPWEDSGTEDNDATSAGGARPTYQAGEVNGKPVVRFDGTDDTLSGAINSVIGNVGTYFIVLREASGEGSGYIFCWDDNNDAIDQGFGFGGNSVEEFDGGSAIEIGTVSSVSFNTYVLRRNSTPDTSSFKNGVAGGTRGGSSKTTTGATYRIAARGGAGGDFWAGDIAELIIFKTALSAGNRGTVEDYLRVKYALY
jgi:hypothetical protein